MDPGAFGFIPILDRKNGYYMQVRGRVSYPDLNPNLKPNPNPNPSPNPNPNPSPNPHPNPRPNPNPNPSPNPNPNLNPSPNQVVAAETSPTNLNPNPKQVVAAETSPTGEYALSGIPEYLAVAAKPHVEGIVAGRTGPTLSP